MNPAISVIIPVYNVQKYIARCLESILSQTFTDFEVIVVDDCTPDRSMDIVNDYARRDSRITTQAHVENIGQGVARKTGYTLARGRWFCFVDSDDYLPSDALENLYRCASGSDADLVIAGSTSIASDGSQRTLLPSPLPDMSGPAVLRATIEHRSSQTLWGKLFNRRLFDGRDFIMPKGTTMGEDALLLYQLLMTPSIRIVTLAKSVYFYMLNDDSSTRRKLSDRDLQQRGAICRLLHDILIPYPDLLPIRMRDSYRTLVGLKLKGYKNRRVRPAYALYGMDHLYRLSVIRQYFPLYKALPIHVILNLFSLRIYNKN